MSKTTLKIDRPKNILMAAITLSAVSTLAQVLVTVYAVLKANQAQAPTADPVSLQLQTIRKAYDTLNSQTVN